MDIFLVMKEWKNKLNKNIYFFYVTGVILANASLDIAFHDTILMGNYSMLALLHTVSIIEKNEHIKKSDNEYIKMFWVGLMDGDGSIQVNHWRKQSLQFRLVIKLSNLASNYNMLIKIAKVIGGNIRVTGKGKDVIWVVNDKKIVQEIIKIFDIYPLLTSKKICQLKFLKKCIEINSVDWYLSNRNNKYIDQSVIINTKSLVIENNSFILPPYFKEWFSGFVEAEGCFCIRKNYNYSFSIGQNDDIYLINIIKQYLKASNLIRNPYRNFYLLEIYKKETIITIISHFNNYPLLGEKAKSFQVFKQRFLQ